MSHVDLLYSSLATDPVLGEIVEMFVDEMPSKIGNLLALADAGDWGSLGRTAHQLKGAFGSHGFGQITSNAFRLETAARDGGSPDEILDALNELVEMCRCVRAGTPVVGNPKSDATR